MDNIFSSNISQRSEEGNITKNQWRIFKQFCKRCIAGALIPFLLLLIIKGIFILLDIPDKSFWAVKNPVYILQTIFFIIICADALFKIFYYYDYDINKYVQRKSNFYHTAYTILSEKYSFTNEELKKLKILKESFEDKCSIKSYYLIPIGLFGPMILFVAASIIIILADYSLYEGVSIDTIVLVFLFIFICSIVIFILCFVVPVKKRMLIWHIINTNEKEIVDEISRLLTSKNIIERPLCLEINNMFKKPYLLFVTGCAFVPLLYFAIEIDNANMEKKYLNMIYPVEDKLLEILEY